MTNQPKRRIATSLIHAGRIRTNMMENAEALFLTSGFVYDDAEQAEAAFAQPDPALPVFPLLESHRRHAGSRLCEIEGAEACRATATGMAAVNAALLCGLKTGDRVVASRALFGSCHWIVSTLLPQYGIDPSSSTAPTLRPGKPPSRKKLPWSCWKPHQSHARHGRSARRLRACPRRWRHRRRRQRFCHPAAAAPVGIRRRCDRLFRHQAYGRPGPRARRCRTFQPAMDHG